MRMTKNKKSGFALIEMLIFLAIFVICGLTFYKALTFGTKNILESKNRLAAIAVANEKMEIIRSLDYASIGTKKSDGGGGWVYNIPRGETIEEEDVSRNGRNFYVHTFVKYVDDSFDYLAATPSPDTDIVPTDYKAVRIQVSWDETHSDSKSVFLTSTFVPPSKEEMGTGGLLFVNVTDGTSNFVPQASVRLTNSVTSTDSTYPTGDDGGTMFPEVTEDLSGKYKIEISKTGYYPIQTYPPYDPLITDSFDPVNKDVAIQNATITNKPMTIDKVSFLTIDTRDMFGNAIPGVDFSLEGGLKLGTDGASNPVYSYKKNNDSGASGSVDITDALGISSGSYVFTLISAPAQFEFVQMSTAKDASSEFSILPGITLTESALFADKTINSFIGTILKDSDGLPIVGASVRLKNTTLGYDVTLISNEIGKVYFPQDATPLSAVQYDVEVTASGFTTLSDTVDINALTKKDFKMVL